MFVPGAIVKTKTDNTGTPNGLYKVYADPNGATIGALKQSAYVGVFIKTIGDWSQIRLRTSLGGKQYGWILTDKIYQWAAPYTYFVADGRTGVNVRTSPSLTASIVKKLNAGQTVGKSDGYQENGFILFALNGGGIGWVSRDYVTRQNTTLPTGGTGTTTTNTPPIVIDTIPQEKTDLVKYSGYAVIFFSCILLITLVRYGIKFAK